MTTGEHPLLGGTDGYRSEAVEHTGPGHMNPETVAGLTHALIEHQRAAGIDGPVVIAQDTRPSGPALRHGVLAAAAELVTDIVDLGTVPTPTAQKVADRYGAMATVVITASHNPYTDNGWKGMLGSRKPSSDEARVISDRYWQQVENGLVVPTHPDKLIPSAQAHETEWYTAEVVADIEREFGAEPLKDRLFVLDGAHGAARSITPEVFRRLGARVETFACGDGYINDGCGAANLTGLKHFLGKRPDITCDPAFVGGLANDGDGDRVMAVGISEAGELLEVTGNHTMEALALDPHQPGIVGTVYTNSGVRERLQNHAIGFEECDNGDVHVTNALRTKQAEGETWQRGGEFTGHLIDTAWLGSGDGVRMAAWFAAHAVRSNQTFGQLYANQPMWPEIMTRVQLTAGERLVLSEAELVQAALGQVSRAGGRAIVRASGTEPVVRVWCEAPDTAIAKQSAQWLLGSVQTTMETAA